MLKLLVITVIVLYLLRFLFRLMYPKLPDQRPPIEYEMKSCDYCGKLMREDKGFHRKQRFFCSPEHQVRYFN